MKCPIDDTDLLITDRSGVEIDYCPKCRGVWLDRGELDKLIERAGSFAQQPAQPRYEEPRPRPQERHDYYEDRHDSHSSHGSHNDGHHKHKKESFLGDLFDF